MSGLSEGIQQLQMLRTCHLEVWGHGFMNLHGNESATRTSWRSCCSRWLLINGLAILGSDHLAHPVGSRSTLMPLVPLQGSLTQWSRQFRRIRRDSFEVQGPVPLQGPITCTGFVRPHTAVCPGGEGQGSRKSPSVCGPLLAPRFVSGHSTSLHVSHK